MIHGAWRTGEPGVFFIDEANHYNPVPHLGELRGDQSRAASSRCCRTTSATSARSTSAPSSRSGTRSTGTASARVIHLSTHFLDNIIDVNKYPLPEITDLAQRIRRIGLGVMGFADLLVRLGIPYDSEEASSSAGKILQFVDDEAKNESERLAGERGVFPEWERSIWGPDETCARDAERQAHPPDAAAAQLQRHHRRADRHDLDHRRLARGIEPLFAVAFMRNQAGVLMPDVNEDFVAHREGRRAGTPTS